jgi:hypothetical protein
MQDDGTRKSAASCKVCKRQLTIDEFRACSGIGHYCSAHLPSKARSAATKPASKKSPSTGRGRKRVSDSGAVEYSCKAQFAGTGVIRAGKLTTGHAASYQGHAVFVLKKIGYGPGEILTLFIADRDGRRLAERSGFECHA